MLFYSEKHRQYETEASPFSSGGEAMVYRVKHHPELVAKIYRPEKITLERMKKTHAMSKLKVPEYLRESVALPEDVLYTDSSLTGFAGYVMKRVDHITELQDIYYHDDVNLYRKVTIAMNLCVMVNLVHMSKQVIGDFNPKNIAIDSVRRVGVLIDTDSFHIKVKNSRNQVITYPCTVGVESLIAPELREKLKRQKATLESIQGESFTIETDLYALGFHLFALLMGGTTPYRAAVNMHDLGSSHTVSSITIDQFEASKKGEFLFARRIFGKKLPDDVPDFDLLSPELRALFTRCFVDGASDPKKRPTAEEYFLALKNYQKSLQEKGCGHYLRSGYHKPCGWCKLKR